MRRCLYELARLVAAVLRPRCFLELPINRRLMASSNAIERVL